MGLAGVGGGQVQPEPAQIEGTYMSHPGLSWLPSTSMMKPTCRRAGARRQGVIHNLTRIQRSWRSGERADAHVVVCELPQCGPYADLLLQPWPPCHFRLPGVANLLRET